MTTTTAETQRAGELSNRLETALQAAGKEVTDEQIGAALAAVDKAQSDYTSLAILTGVTLLKKKCSLKHGQWKPYLERLAAKDDRVKQAGNTRLLSESKSAARCTFPESYRSIAIYMHLAKRFLADCEQRKLLQKDGWAGEAFEQSLDVLGFVRGEMGMVDQVKAYVGGRSMRRLLIDLREADKDAMEEEIEEQRHQARLDGTDKTPAQAVEQLFFAAWVQEKAQLDDKLFKRPDLESLPTAMKARYFEDLAETLRAKAEQAETFAKANREKVA